MKQEQISSIATAQRFDMIRFIRSRRFISSLLFGISITIVLSLVEILFVSFPRFPALLSHEPFLFLIPLFELILVAVITFLALKPLAILAYLRAVHRVQAKYHTLYTPLTAMTNILQAGDAELEAGSLSPTSLQDEQVSILDLVQQQHTHQLILGLPGAGKTTALRVFQYIASQRSWSLIFSREQIPVYIPMKNYSLFLKKEYAHETAVPSSPSLVTYLVQSDLPGMRHLRQYMVQLFSQGRLLLLCDGLNEIDSNYLAAVSKELVLLMRETQNRLVMTCREVDYREQPDFVQLVDEGEAVRAEIFPLQPEQVYEFVERYVEKQDKYWRHTAGQIMQIIDRSRLRYHCTNPMMLFTLMGIIDKIGVERGKQIDTRGRLLREYVRQLVINEQQNPKWSRDFPDEQDVILFLSEIACAARWANDRNAVQLQVSSSLLHRNGGISRINVDELLNWLHEHPAHGPFMTNEIHEISDRSNADQLLQFAVSTALIEISTDGVLSFRHELIAEYFVAEYFYSAAPSVLPSLTIREELLRDIPRWSEPVAIWAGLLDDPLELAACFGTFGVKNQSYVQQALTLGLVCVGVLWTPPQAEIQSKVVLPQSIEDALALAVRSREAREELAVLFTRAAEEGGQEVYRSLLPLITIDGVDELIMLLDPKVVSDLLFTQLQDAVDNIAYDTQVKRIARVLGRYGGPAIERAAQLSLPAPERSMRLRAAAINILGGTNDARSVEPLIARLRDAEPFIIGRATNALIRLGPALVVPSILQELDNRTPDPLLVFVHQAALTILSRFLDEQDPLRIVSLSQYQHILEHIVPVLSSNYQNEQKVQQQAHEVLVHQGRNAQGIAALDVRDNRWEKAIDIMLSYLSSQDELVVQNVVTILKEIASPAVPRLLIRLDHPSETVRIYIIDVLSAIRDLQALPSLLQLLGNSSSLVQQRVAEALRIYAPESIPGLIDLVLHAQEDRVANQAVQILVNIGEPVVMSVIDALGEIVPGRTRFLVNVLARVRDQRAVPALIALLQRPQLEPLLVVAIIRALCQFPDQRVVSPLLRLLATTNPLISEEAVTALSQLGRIALNDLIEALDVEADTTVSQRVRRAILGISPFPGEELILALEQSSRGQATQIMEIFKKREQEAAPVLVKHLLHPDEQVREYIHDMLQSMPGSTVVPALLGVLHQSSLQKVVCTFLLRYPEDAIAPLVDLLNDPARGAIIETLLPQFGSRILRPLLVGLDDQRSVARERAQRTIVQLVQRSSNDTEKEQVLYDVLQLFSPAPQPRAREALLNVLTKELADVIIPILLSVLDDVHLLEYVAESFVRLVQQPAFHETVLDRLIDALFVDDRRPGAEIALIRISDGAVPRVGDLITHPDSAVARSAKHILCEIGVPALAFIWTAYSDRNNPARREAARAIFRNMPPHVIKDELITLLVSDNRDDLSMAVSLLVERVHDEATELSYAQQVMVPELIDYIQTHKVHETNLRIMALLLLLGEPIIVDHLLQALDENPQHQKSLTYLFLLFGPETQDLLLNVLDDPNMSPELRADVASIVSMQSASDQLVATVRDISTYGLSSPNRNGSIYSEQLAIALRVLGGLLASGQWHAKELHELRDACADNDPLRELFNVLLGWRYEPQIARLQKDIETQRETFKKELLTFTAAAAEQQQHIASLETELEKAHEEHGLSKDELLEVQREKDVLRARLDKLNRDHIALKAIYEQETKEKSRINAQLQALQRQQAQASQSQTPQTR